MAEPVPWRGRSVCTARKRGALDCHLCSCDGIGHQTYRLKMRSFPDALGRSALEEPRRIPRRICGLPVAVPLLPSAAYRLLLELLWRDSSFCHLTVPYFHASGHVSLLVCDGGQSQEEKE